MSAVRWLSAVATVAIMAAPARARATPCVVRGTAPSLIVSVQPAGENAFDVSVDGQPVEVTLPGDDGRATAVRVAGTLAFEGTAADPGLRMARDLAVAHGMLQLWPGAWLSEVREVAGVVLATVVLEWSSEEDDADEVVSSVEVPCGALTLASPASEKDTGDDDTDEDAFTPASFAAIPKPPPSRWWRVVGGEVRVHAQPTSRAPAVQLTARCAGCLLVREIRAKGSWILVERDADLATLTGWIPRRTAKALKRAPEEAKSGSGYGVGIGGRGTALPADVYEGPARVAAGTRVCLAGGAGCWAGVAHVVEMRVRHRRGDAWVELLDIPGVSPTPPVFVAVAAVALPASHVTTRPARR